MSRATADDFEEHVSSAAIPDRRATTSDFPHGGKPNAFTELMKPKPKPISKPVDSQTQQTVFYGRDGLGAYTADPASFPDTRVVYYTEKFVVIRDLYPKAFVHLLILPRNSKRNKLAPQDAFDDADFLKDCRDEEKKVRKMVADELRRNFAPFSASDQARLKAMEAADLPDELPPGRDWSKDVISGIHANPSMNHVHIHVLSKDMVSEPMRKRNHYLSFTTDFLVGLEHFPLASDDYRRNYHKFPEDMLCWRCHRNFGNKMVKLKEHLEEEFENWKRE